MADTASALPLAISMGDPAGIGPEITIKSWAERERENLAVFFAVGNVNLYKETARLLKLDIGIQEISSPGQAGQVFPDALPVLPIDLVEPATPGIPSASNAVSVLASIDTACDFALDGSAAGLVTNPIHKRTLYEGGLRVPGHTEYLAERCGGATPLMMLSCPGLRVVPVTVHLSLGKAVESLRPEAIIEQGQILAEALKQDFGVERPRIAVAALNPHAGEEGHLGHEEIEIIAPAVEALRDLCPAATFIGPSPADTLFHAAARTRYDAVLCMYHDQALIPLKTIDFENGVNTTLGLPIIRSSPDHGTAFDIAGKGVAHPGSLIAAIRTASQISYHRKNA
ncbi:4-hydroxythreonine-4-phosphate dehydrogenase PdxA [Parvibaculum sp.]|uniref:4-hydroxythreonine-4-phosphate dehydrogenase PdxA n=3 Tax=Parvibaculum sp. TaxID=2024848 RepID=UPI001B260D8F|nr:4-hydroxythreonine-4-phosphate dehydrogenase PdxA [Parvibaculum sp.]MBO6678926.1 4-hydroxythreonine-4-phosphate dehydrogenase PdxA [Parvibaculum sp.]MBO6904359.1 4-hydroxythreonine-4-phosphate dehydrogenase PdxA [Parvibaculum sp.]